jgi:hypothetical protein
MTDYSWEVGDGKIINCNLPRVLSYLINGKTTYLDKKGNNTHNIGRKAEAKSLYVSTLIIRENSTSPAS